MPFATRFESRTVMRIVVPSFVFVIITRLTLTTPVWESNGIRHSLPE